MLDRDTRKVLYSVPFTTREKKCRNAGPWSIQSQWCSRSIPLQSIQIECRLQLMFVNLVLLYQRYEFALGCCSSFVRAILERKVVEIASAERGPSGGAI